ncbi:hypothetical protein [Flavobacterium sp.]|uniref:hypothetical protein n=1 Tax=Flavobacterium sp. TaxID=239 RepID=UPI00260A5D94|nr:hypothetical protein [Flavobacterium sp.]
MCNLNNIYSLLGAWEDLVRECTVGYDSNIFEFDYDFKIRADIAEVLSAQNGELDEQVSRRLKEIDNDFLKLLMFLDEREELLFWDRKFVLKFGSKEYASSVFETFKVTVEILEQ